MRVHRCNDCGKYFKAELLSGRCYKCFAEWMQGNSNVACAAIPGRSDALPGTDDKIRVLQQRASLRQQLFREDEPEYRASNPVFYSPGRMTLQDSN